MYQLCLDRAWVEGSSSHRVQSTITLEVSVESNILKYDLDKTAFKDAEEARTMIRSQAVRNAGIHYLEYESLELQTSSGKVWKIYGSPVSSKPRVHHD